MPALPRRTGGRRGNGDRRQRLPVILTKEVGTTRVFRAPSFADGPLALIASLPVPQPASPLLTQVAGLTVTGADLSPDGRRMLLRTYDSVIELTSPDGPPSIDDLAEWAATELPAPFEPQGEAVAYLPDGHGYVTVSEGSGGALDAAALTRRATESVTRDVLRVTVGMAR